jgi:hypothetical protein
MYHSEAGGGSKEDLQNPTFRAAWNAHLLGQGVDPDLVEDELEYSSQCVVCVVHFSASDLYKHFSASDSECYDTLAQQRERAAKAAAKKAQELETDDDDEDSETDDEEQSATGTRAEQSEARKLPRIKFGPVSMRALEDAVESDRQALERSKSYRLKMVSVIVRFKCSSIQHNITDSSHAHLDQLQRTSQQRRSSKGCVLQRTRKRGCVT